MRASEPHLSRFDALRRTLARLSAGLVVLALVAGFAVIHPVSALNGASIATPVPQVVVAMADTDLVSLPAEPGDEYARTQHRQIGFEDLRPAHAAVVRILAPVRYLPFDAGPPRLLSRLPPGRGPPSFAA